MKLTIKKCPFCGSEAELLTFCLPFADESDYKKYVQCSNDDCMVCPSTDLCATADEAIEIWNKRF